VIPFRVSESSTLKRDGYFQLQRLGSSDGQRMLVKFAIAEYPSTEEAMLEREFTLFRAVAPSRRLEPVQLERIGGKLAAYFRDFDGLPLSADERLKQAQVSDVFPIVRDLCATLCAVQATGNVLVGVAADSFLVHRDKGEVVLADAPFAQPIGSLSRSANRDSFGLPYLLYAAPELLGGAAIPLDARTDLYSLGALIYRLLGGRAPFESQDAAEIIHCHLARQPAPLHALRSDIPPDLADWVMRLLSKRQGDRPEITTALLDYLDGRARVAVANRAATESELTPTFSLPDRLYGREEPFRVLLDAVKEARRRSTIVSVEGEAGIGKTALIRQLRRSPAAKISQFCEGKFEQTGRDEPLGAWAAVLHGLAAVTLTLADLELDSLRRELQSDLGDLAGLIGVLVPEWSAILGSPPEAPGSFSDATLERQAIAIHRVLHGFADADEPLVLFLDDVQWADASSLHILKRVVSEPDSANLLVVLASRSADGGVESPTLAHLREELEANHPGVTRIALRPLEGPEVDAFLSDSLNAPVARASELSALLLAKTGGSPFFLREFLSLLVQRRVLSFQSGRGCWTWSIEGIEALPVAENVVGFLTGRILHLPENVKVALRSAACLGPQFCMADVTALCDFEDEAAIEYLAIAAAEGLIRRSQAPIGALDAEPRSGQPDVALEFVHDRVLEACRALLDEDEEMLLHLSIARIFLRRAPAHSPALNAYGIAVHMNAARAILRDASTRIMAAQMNLRAAHMATERGAFSQALGLLLAAFEFLGGHVADGPTLRPSAEGWTTEPELTARVHLDAAQAAFLNSQLDLMNLFCDETLRHVDSPLQRAAAYEIRISGLKAAKQFGAAVSAGLEILAQLDAVIPKNPSVLRLALGFYATKQGLVRNIASLTGLAPLRDQKVRARTRIIQAIYPAAYLGAPKVFPILVYRHIAESIRHGNEGYSAVTYTAFAVVLCAMGDLKTAFRLANVGLEVLSRFKAERLKASVFSIYYFLIFPWRNAIRDAIPYYVVGWESGLEHGDFEYTCYLITQHALARFHSGTPLPPLETEFAGHTARIESLGQERSILMQKLLCQLVFELQRRPAGAQSLAGPFYDEAELLPRCKQPLDHNLVFHNHFAQMILGAFMGDRSALDSARLGRAHLAEGAFGSYLGAVFLFYESLLLLADPGSRSSRSARRRIRSNQRKLDRWQREAPMNFANKFHLVEAERCRTSGRSAAAATHFEKAIELAHVHGLLHEAALAQERAAAFYLERGMPYLGRHYLRECQSSYERWGAGAKVDRLQVEHAQHFAFLSAAPSGLGAMTSARFSDTLDYRSVLKASQAISSETRFPRLGATLLKVLLEHAGAQRGLLLLERNGQLFVEAEGDVDAGQVDAVERELLDDTMRLCRPIVHYVARTEKTLVIEDASRHELFGRDPYVRLHRPRSVLCIPILYQGRLLGVMYLENNRMSHLFTQARYDVMNILASQAAISIANARFHAIQLEAQQAKISPHFLFNALSSIAGLAVSDGAKAEEAITRLAQLYRYILTTSSEELVTLGQELEVVRTYLALEQMRFGAKLSFTIESEGDVTAVRIPGLLIQPLVENSIRHGISRKLTPGRVAVHTVASRGRCWISVQDDGDGAKHGTSGTGFGLRSVQERLALVYGEEYSLAITQAGGYRVEIEIPAAPARVGTASWKARAAASAAKAAVQASEQSAPAPGSAKPRGARARGSW
jgi:predicted ATPase